MTMQLEMKKDVPISVIMPVYNAGVYLKPAVQSVLDQTFSSFELILIDDGATDGSAEVCEQFAKRDSRVRLVHQKNGGISCARNVALRMAKGRYITFCDHDDLYEKEYLNVAYRAIQSTKLPVVKFTYRSEAWVTEQVRYTNTVTLPDKEIALEYLARNNYTLFNTLISVIWNGIYEKDFLQKNNFYFDEEIKTGMEDYLFNLQVLPRAENIKMIRDCLFTHFSRVGQSAFAKYDALKLAAIRKAAQRESMYFTKLMCGKRTRFYQKSNYLALMVNFLCMEACPLSFREKSLILDEVQKEGPFNQEDHIVWRNNLKRSLMVFLFKRRCYRLLFACKKGWNFGKRHAVVNGKSRI